MKRIAAVALLALFSFSAEISACEGKPSTTVKRDGIGVTIEANTDAAEIFLDGKFVGSTPMNYRFRPGNHPIELRKEGFTTWRRTLHVAAGQPTRVKANLTPLAAQ